jgi:hypothetical protein
MQLRNIPVEMAEGVHEDKERRSTSWASVTPLPQRALHPTDHVQQDTHPTDNPPQSARKNGAEEAQRQGGRRRGRPPSAGRHRPRGMRRRPAPAPATPPATRSRPQRTPLQTTHTAGNPHTAGDGHRPEDAHDALPQRVGVLRATPADSRA